MRISIKKKISEIRIEISINLEKEIRNEKNYPPIARVKMES